MCRITLVFLAVLGICAGAWADSLSCEDEELEFLEIEVVESGCGDSAFRKSLGVSWDRCTKKALSAVPVCTKTLHQFAPRDNVVNDPKRLSKDNFVSRYSKCLKREFRTGN